MTRTRLLLLSAMAAALAGAAGAARAQTQAYAIAGNDGYGLEDCLSAGSECGHVVADAWCEAHGHGHALSFGPRPENNATPVAASSDSYVVTCGD